MKFDFYFLGVFYKCTIDCKDREAGAAWSNLTGVGRCAFDKCQLRRPIRGYLGDFNRWEPLASKNIALNANRIVKRHARSVRDAKPAVAVNREQPKLEIRRWYHRFTQPRSVWYRVRHITAEGTPSFKKVYINREDEQQPREWSRAATDAMRRDDDFIDIASTPPSREEIEKHYREIGDLCKDYLINANNFPLAEKDDSE
jgi:hypothetical protein